MAGGEFQISKATKQGRKARVFLSGVSGAGKTYTALTWAAVLGKTVVVVDTENASALDYAPRPGETADPVAGTFDFEHLPLRAPYTVDRYIAAMNAAAQHPADVIVVDSLSHAWAGKGGLLALVDEYGRAHRGDSFSGWRDATPKHLELIEAMLSLPAHLIATARSKQDWSMERNEQGRTVIQKLGLAPVQRDGLEYEFAVAADLSIEHVLTITKTRCRELDGWTETKPGTEVAERLVAWLDAGETIDAQIEAAFMAAQDATTADELVGLMRRTRPDILRAQVPDETGAVVTLETYISAKGRVLREAERANRPAAAS